MYKSRGLIAVVLCLLAGASALAWERELAEAKASKESTKYYEQVKRLDPNDKKALKLLFKLAEAEDWYIREACMEVLGSASGEALADIEKELKRGNTLTQEVIALGFGLSQNADRVPSLIEALDTKDFTVKQAAAIALGQNHHQSAIPAILEVWKKEKDARLMYRYHEALKAITGEKIDAVVVDWENWWKGVGEGFVPPSRKPKEEGQGPGGPPAPKKEEGTVLRDVNLSFTESGSGGPLFVLPEYGYNKEYLVPTMKALEGTARIFYIDLPPIENFKNLQTVGGTGLPEYPIDKLVEAFDELRQQRKQKTIAIMGHGITAWVAMRYASKYPENVSHLILVSTWTSGRAWGKGRDAVERIGKEKGDLEQEHFAQSLLIDMQTGRPTYQPKDQVEGEALSRMRWSTYFADRRNGMASVLYPECLRQMGGCLVPEFDVGKEKGNPVPTLIIYGKHAMWTDRNDMRQLNKYYPNSSMVECPSSAMVPMLEDFDVFTKSLTSFFRKYKFRQTMGKP